MSKRVKSFETQMFILIASAFTFLVIVQAIVASQAPIVTHIP